MRTANRSFFLLALALISTLAPASPAQGLLTGKGTSTVDGQLSPGEWDEAAQVEVPARNVNGKPVAAVLYLMNDSDNLYIALRVAASDTTSATWSVLFDNDADGVTESGEDQIVLGAGGFGDQVLQQILTGALQTLDDLKVGGQRNGTGARGVAAGNTILELSHPLSSGDAADYSTAPGHVIGIQSTYRACGSCPISAWPEATRYVGYQIGVIPPPALSGCGTAVINGELGEDEWNGAAVVPFQSLDPDGNTHSSRLLVMNDSSNLYLAVEVESTAKFRAGVGFEFDNDNDGSTIIDREEGDDEFVLNNMPVDNFTDATRSNLPPCTELPPLFCSFLDDDRGGTQDGTGATSFNGSKMVFEISHPLHSGDARDFSLGPGDTVGYHFMITMCDTDNCENAHLPDSFHLGRIRICEPEAAFEYSLEKWALARVDGLIGVDALLHTHGLAPGAEGATGWSVSIADLGGCAIADATLIGTAAQDAEFSFVNLTSGPGNEGVVSGVVLDLTEPVTLDPVQTPHRILRMGIAPDAAGCESCAIAFKNGLRGVGQPVSQYVTYQGKSLVPALPGQPLKFEACGCFASSPPPPGWMAANLGTVSHGSSRNPLKSIFELCSDASGYGSKKDSLRVAHWLGGPHGIAAILEDLQPGVTAGVELRRGQEILADDSFIGLSVTREAQSDALILSAAKRESRGAAKSAVRLEAPPGGNASPALPLQLQIIELGLNEISLSVQGADNFVLAWANLNFDVHSEPVFPGLAHASPGGVGSARFCAVFPPLPGYDTDGDGCQDCEDQHPDRAIVSVRERGGPCCGGNFVVYHFEGKDSDGDGIRDCKDPDDDNDGIPDADDPCPLGGSCDSRQICCVPGDWVACKPFECSPYFLKVFNTGDPQMSLVFEHLEIVNFAFYLEPLMGRGVEESVEELVRLAAMPGRGGGGGVRAQTLTFELWGRSNFPAKEEMVAKVGSFELGDFDLEAVDGGRLLYLEPPLDGKTGKVGGVWVVGQPLHVFTPDGDGDGIPDAFDNCPGHSNPDQADQNQNGIGDVCDVGLIEALGLMLPGDGNQDGQLDISDAVQLLGMLFLGVGHGPCGDGTLSHDSNVRLLDSNGDHRVDLSDSVTVMSFLFLGGPPPVRGTECIAFSDCSPACFPH